MVLGCQNRGEQLEIIKTKVIVNKIQTLKVPDVTVSLEQLELIRLEGQWKLDNIPYSGYGLSYFSNGQLQSKIGFVNGKKEGQATEYFEDGHPKSITSYHKNMMHGEVKNWSGAKGHSKLAVRNFYLNKPHGTHEKWYPNGNLMKVITYNMGHEEGLQQAFLENGKIYANYEAKNGRTFGLKRSILCYELEDGIVKSSIYSE